MFFGIPILILDDVVYNQTMGPGATLDKRRPDLRDELGYIAPPNRKLPPVPGSNYNTCDRIKRGTVISKHLNFPKQHLLIHFFLVFYHFVRLQKKKYKSNTEIFLFKIFYDVFEKAILNKKRIFYKTNFILIMLHQA